MKSNSQTLLSSRIYLGDIDGDQLDEILEVDGRHLYIFKCNYDHTPVLEHIFASPVKRLIIGDYVTSGRERGKDQIFAILEDGSIQGWAISDNLKEMWWWFTQPSFIKDTDHFIVGDFDGDSADEIMVYEPSTGRIKLYKFQKNGFLVEMSGYKLGNLEGRDLKNKLILAGDFGQPTSRKDILIVDRAAGQITRFDTATDPDGKTTFHWAFTSASKLFGNVDELIVSNISGGDRDGLVVRNSSTSQYKLFKLEFNGGKLIQDTSIDVGQLPIQPGRGRIIAAKVREAKLRNERGVSRDDILYFDSKSSQIIQTDARFDAAKNMLTYWWAYTRNYTGRHYDSTIRVHLKILTTPNVAIESMIESMRQVYRTARIRVDIGSTENLNLPALNDLDVGECIRGRTTDEQNQLFAYRNNVGNNDISVYLVRSTVPPYNGCAAHPGGRNGAVVVQGATRWTMAHEVGHVLGLNHVDDNNRLMTGNGTANITNPPPDLVDAEIRAMDASALTVNS
jgi:hypothetical protein